MAETKDNIFGDVEDGTKLSNQPKIPTPEELDGKVEGVTTIPDMDDSASKSVENPANKITLLEDDPNAGSIVKGEEVGKDVQDVSPPLPNPFVLTVMKEREFLFEALGGLLKIEVPPGGGAGRYKSMAYSNMEAGRNWMGKLLNELQVPNPYTKMADVNSLEVDKATDTTDGILATDGDPITASKKLRELLQVSIDDIQNYRSSFASASLGMVVLNNIYTYLVNSKMYLGWMIAKMAEENAK